MNNKIEELRNKIRKKQQEDENPCPTGILFYIATARQAFGEVNPWYNQVKKLAEGANRHHKEHHEAVIYGMYPELEDACKYFNEEMRAYFENHETCTKEDAQKIENNTIRKFNLKNKYSFLNPNEEQKKRIILNQEKAENIEFAKDMRDKSPVVQMLGYGLKDNVNDTEKLTKNMFLLDVTLKRGPEWVKENAQNFSELSDLFEMAEKIFDLQKQGAITEDFSVNDFKKVKESSLVRDMNYEGKNLNLENKVKNPHLNIDFSRKGLEV